MHDHIVLRLCTDLQFYAKHNIYIIPKSGEPIPFVFNRAQKYIHECIEKQKRITGKVRAIILKGRQQGCSTYVGARFYHQTVCNKGVYTFIFAHDSQASRTLFENVNMMYTMSDPSFRPTLGASNAKELLFPGICSGYKVGTAGTPGLGRSKTFQQVHWSEVAYSPNCVEHAAGILQTVSDDKGTEIIMESTANGQGDFFYRMCLEAISGASEYELIFVPWYWQPEYRKSNLNFLSDSLSSEETKYLELYEKDGLTVEHLIWRRYKIKEFDNDEVRFKREYPFNVEEAFYASNDDAFVPVELILRARHCQAISSPDAPLVIGVDPARLGKDSIVLCFRRGRSVTDIRKLPKMDTVALQNYLANVINQDKPLVMCIDVGGLGVGIYDNLVAWGYGSVVKLVNFGSEADNRDRYFNKRAEMYGRAKAWLEDTPCFIHAADQRCIDALQSELSCIKIDQNNRHQKIKLESKDEIKSRGLPSPDHADAFVLTFSMIVPMSSSVSRVRETFIPEKRWNAFEC